MNDDHKKVIHLNYKSAQVDRVYFPQAKSRVIFPNPWRP